MDVEINEKVDVIVSDWMDQLLIYDYENILGSILTARDRLLKPGGLIIPSGATGLGIAIGAKLMDLKKATTLGSVTVMTFMLASGYFVKNVPIFISWLRYLSFNYHAYRLLLKVQYEDMTQTIDNVEIDSGITEVCTLAAMIFGYFLLAYISLRGMKLH
ncbi:ABC transporter G family member 22-like isoform X2 [Apium graveolens]|uniref:ABC transporter G family member 22-like isoform X2 n=1 Tax=Apium graveolens TaxID=4045 RepID=UPI003D790DFA